MNRHGMSCFWTLHPCFNSNRSSFRTQSGKSCQRQLHLSPLLRGWWPHLRTLPTPAGRVQPHFWTLHGPAASPLAAPGRREGAGAGPDWRAPACRICRSRSGLWRTPTVPWSRTGRRPAAGIHLVQIVEERSQKENHALMTSSDLAPPPSPPYHLHRLEYTFYKRPPVTQGEERASESQGRCTVHYIQARLVEGRECWRQFRRWSHSHDVLSILLLQFYSFYLSNV